MNENHNSKNDIDQNENLDMAIYSSIDFLFSDNIRHINFICTLI